MPGRLNGLRLTLPTQLVLRALLDDPTQEMYGLEISGAAGLVSGTIHPILARLEGAGIVASRWEDIDQHVEGRPRRRYYRLTPTGSPRTGRNRPGLRLLTLSIALPRNSGA